MFYSLKVVVKLFMIRSINHLELGARRHEGSWSIDEQAIIFQLIFIFQSSSNPNIRLIETILILISDWENQLKELEWVVKFRIVMRNDVEVWAYISMIESRGSQMELSWYYYLGIFDRTDFNLFPLAIRSIKHHIRAPAISWHDFIVIKLENSILKTNLKENH